MKMQSSSGEIRLLSQSEPESSFSEKGKTIKESSEEIKFPFTNHIEAALIAVRSPFPLLKICENENPQ